MINRNPLVRVGRPGLAPNTFKELMALMKKQRLKEALPGFGTTGHLTSRLFAQDTKLKFDMIPYRGGAPAMTDLLGDHVDLHDRHAAADDAAGQGRQAQGLRGYAKGKIAELPTADSMADLLGPQFAIVLLAGPVCARPKRRRR